MGIDMTDPDKPYHWYIMGLFDKVDICFSSPQIFTKMDMDWIEETMINNS